MTEIEIRPATTVEEIVAASHLFDKPVKPEWSERFLAASGHHILLAYVDGAPAGMITGVETTHPDKGTEMFLYELAVDEAYRKRGIGKALTAELAARARKLGCYGMWVGTERDNAAALATYASAGGEVDLEDFVTINWRF